MKAQGNILTITHSHEGPVGHYLSQTPFRLKASHSLESVPPSILVIPFLGSLVPLSWIKDCQIIAGEVDEGYMEGVEEVRRAMQVAYPSLKFLGSIEAKAVPSVSTWDPNKYCLLYSGGVDSTSSYLRNRSRAPTTLLMIRGTPELRLADEEYWQRSVDRLAPALRAAKAEWHIIETNALDVVDAWALKDKVHTDEVHSWWENFAHGIFLTSTCAPYTYFSQTGKLLIASSYSPISAKPWGSMPESDERIRWGGLTVTHDSFDITRFEKIRDYLSPFILSQGGSFPIKLCLGKEERLNCGKLNCGRCNKCITTALMLLETGVDPARCEFDMSRFSPNDIRVGLENGYLHQDAAPNSWRFITENAHPLSAELESEYKGMSSFLQWLSTWDRKPKESTLRTYSRKVAPVGSRRRKLVRLVLNKG